jgi:hypothetical protein
MSADVVVEKVPKFTRRYGDQVFEGSNNTIIIMGTDRAKKGPASIKDGIGHVDADGKGVGAGTIHLIAGRGAEDPDLAKDESFLYLTRKSKVDENLGLTSVEKEQKDLPAAILKSDLIRIVGRKDIKICANDDEKHFLFMDGKKIKFSFQDGPATLVIEDKKITITMGKDTIEMDDKKAVITIDKTILTMDGKLVKIDSPKINLVGGCGKPWDELFEKIDTFATTHQHMTAVGPSTPTLPPTPAVDVKTKYQAWKSALSPA